MTFETETHRYIKVRKWRRVTRLDVEQAILNLFDDWVLSSGYIDEVSADFKHVFFIATQRQVCEKLDTSAHLVAQALGGRSVGDIKTDLLVEHGRGFYWKSGPFRFFYPFALRDYFENPPALPRVGQDG